MAIVTKPMIDDLALAIKRDIANAEITVTYTINWSTFDELTNLPYSESWELAGVDGVNLTTLYTGPMLVNGVSSNGAATTARTKVATIAFADLDEDVNSLDEIVAVVTLTPRLPVQKTAQSAQVVVDAP
jgi:hypothetical protein